jgi:hypothetical protein
MHYNTDTHIINKKMETIPEIKDFNSLSDALFPACETPEIAQVQTKDEWLQERCGFVNGSSAADYMGSGTATAKQRDWSAAKIADVGSGFVSAVKSLYLEKAHGYAASGFEGNKSTELGNFAESWVLAKIGLTLNTELIACKESIVILPNTLRCTPDFTIPQTIKK